MSVNNNLKLPTSIIMSYEPRYKSITNLLGEVKRQLRHIDPQLLGEARYEENKHWYITKKVVDFYYFFKDLYYCLQIKNLNTLMEKYEVHATNIESLNSHFDAFSDVKKAICKITSGKPSSIKSTENNRPKPVASPFDELKISEFEKEQIRIFIPMVADDSIPTLIGHLPTLMAAKGKLHSLHPLKSLEFIFNDINLRKNFITISKNGSRWDGVWLVAPGFKPQTAEKMAEYHKEGKMLRYLPGFIKSLGLNREQAAVIKSQAKEGRWEEIIQSLVKFAASL